MKKNEIKGIIYSVRNVKTQQFYIGITTKSLKKRKKDHVYKSLNGSVQCFHKALAINPPEIFEWKVLDFAKSMEELARKEKLYIKVYDAKNSGYNADSGSGFSKPVFQFSVSDGSIIKAYYSLGCAANAVNATKKELSRACLKENYKVKGYLWSYINKSSFEVKVDRRKKGVVQLDIQNNILNVFSSVAKASSTTGVFKSSIAKVCRNERNIAGGFKWKYVELKNGNDGEI